MKTTKPVINGVRILKNGVRSADGTYHPCHYSMFTMVTGDKKKCVTIYARTYTPGLPAELNPQNDSDLQTDYFDKDKARFLEGTPEYLMLRAFIAGADGAGEAAATQLPGGVDMPRLTGIPRGKSQTPVGDVQGKDGARGYCTSGIHPIAPAPAKREDVNPVIAMMIDASESFAGVGVPEASMPAIMPPELRRRAVTPLAFDGLDAAEGLQPSNLFSMEAVTGFLGQRFCAVR